MLRDQGFGAAVRELANQLGMEHKVQIEVDVARAESLGEKEQVGLYQIVRESLNQAVRRGPPSKISVAIRDTAEGEIETIVARQRHGRAAHGRPGRDRRAGLDPQRPLLGRAGNGRRHRDPRRPPRRTPASPTRLRRRWRTATEITGTRGYVLFVWSPAGWTLQQRDGDAARGRRDRRGGRDDAAREQARPFAAPRRPPPLRVHATGLSERGLGGDAADRRARRPGRCRSRR